MAGIASVQGTEIRNDEVNLTNSVCVCEDWLLSKFELNFMEIEGEGGVTATEVNTDLKNEMEGSGPGIEDLLRELKELNGKLKEPLPMRLEAIQEMEDALEELKQRARHQIAAVSNMIPK